MPFIKRLWDFQWAKKLHNTHRNLLANTGHKLLFRRACGVSGQIVKILPREGHVIIKELILGTHRLDSKYDRTVAGSTITTVTLPNTYSSEDDYYNHCWISITKGYGKGQLREITDYDGATRVATLSRAWTYPPSTSAKFKLIEGRSVLDDYELRDRVLTRDDSVICREVPFGIVSIDATEGSAWIFYKETKIPDPPGGPLVCNSSTSTTSTSTTSTSTSSSSTTTENLGGV